MQTVANSVHTANSTVLSCLRCELGIKTDKEFPGKNWSRRGLNKLVTKLLKNVRVSSQIQFRVERGERILTNGQDSAKLSPKFRSSLFYGTQCTPYYCCLSQRTNTWTRNRMGIQSRFAVRGVSRYKYPLISTGVQ